jgi:hypothetical protein
MVFGANNLTNTMCPTAISAQLRFYFYLIEISAIYEGGESEGDSFANLLLVAQPQLPKYTRYPVVRGKATGA